MSKDPEDRTICFCHQVRLKTLLEAIRAGAKTFEELQAQTSCSTGCGGCEYEVRDILKEELDRG